VTDRYRDLNPGAVTAALRSFPRRFRTVLAADPTKDRDEIAALRAPDGRSVRDVLANTVDALAMLGDVVRRVLVTEGVMVPAVSSGSGPSSGDGGTSLSALLDGMDEAAASVADPVAGAPSGALLRTGVSPNGSPVTALDVARRAVQIGADNLRAVEKAMQASGIEISAGDDNDG
jgi:hypothetical protein